MRLIAAYLSLVFMILGAIIFIGGICAAMSGLRTFELPMLAVGVVVFLVASAVRWRTAGAPRHETPNGTQNGHV